VKHPTTIQTFTDKPCTIKPFTFNSFMDEIRDIERIMSVQLCISKVVIKK
jgi:hypothetical protein